MGRIIDVDRLKDILEYGILCNAPADAVNTKEEKWNDWVQEVVDKAPTVEAIPKDNVYKAIQEMMKYEHDGFINISLARLDEILKKCGVSEDGN